MKLTGKQKAFLKREAHDLQPIFQIGKSGLSDESLQQIEDALEKRELIKIHLLQNTELTTNEAAAIIEEKTRATVVQKIGKTIVLFAVSTKDKNQAVSQDLPN